jgi:hypothetical protein
MKLLQFPDDCHIKNRQSMERMCRALNITYERTNSRERLQEHDYDLLWLPMYWISPDEFPGVKIMYGPHHFIFPEGHPICGEKKKEWSQRAVYNCLSEWNRNVYGEFTNTSVIPFVSLPFGIELLPERNLFQTKTDCVIYVKRRDPKDVEFVRSVLEKRGLSYRIFSYGSYSDSEYQKALMETKLVIWLGTHESQGFAFQECLSRNVPILVCDATSMFVEYGSYKEYIGKKQLKSTTASWWSHECGEQINGIEGFEETLNTMMNKLPFYTPRHFIEQNLTDEKCMNRILRSLNI